MFAGAERRRLVRPRRHRRGARNGSTLAGSSRRRGSFGAAALDRGQPLDVAADAEAAEAGELALAVEHRQAGHLDRQPLGLAVDRPIHHDAAPGVARGERGGDLALRVELERGGDLRPGPVEHGAGLGAEQAGEILGAEREARGCVHLPDEAQRAAGARRRLGGIRTPAFGGLRRAGAGLPARRSAARVGAAKASSSATALWPAPSFSSVTRPAAMSPSARPLSMASRASAAAPSAVRSAAKLVALPKRSRASPPRFDQFAVGGEHRRRPFEVGAQPPRALGQRQLRAGALGRDDQHGVRVVGEHNARAQADQRAAEAGAEAAQAFEPRRAACRQRAGKPRDLRGGRMLRFRSGDRRRRPGDAASKISAPTGLAQSMRGASALHSHAGAGLRACAASRGSLRQANWNSVPFIAVSHARITANETLIRRLSRRVHEAGGERHSQPPITLMCEFHGWSWRPVRAR